MKTKANTFDRSDKKTRRWFLNMVMGLGGIPLLGSALYPITRYLIPPKEKEAVPNAVEAGIVGEMKPNSGKIIRYGRKPVILIRLPSGEFRAFSAICTHLECTVQYREDFEHIWCACHNGHYDLNGKNISGPPPRPLASYEVNIKEDKIYVSKIV